METNEKQYCVYVHTNKTNGKKYVGITSMKPEDRWRNGNGYPHNTYFTRAIKKYGWDEGFTHEIVAENLSEEDAHQMEKDLIAEYNCMNPNGYNATSGGEIGKEYSEELRQRLSEIATERMNDPEVRAKLVEIAANRNYWGENNPNYGNHKLAGENNPNYGKKASEETRRKISEALSNPSEETRKKMSDAAKIAMTPERIQYLREINTGRKATEEAKQKMSESHKARWTDELRQEYSEKFSGEGNGMYGKHHSEETKQKLREMFSGENSYMYGKHSSEETLQKMSLNSPIRKVVVQLDMDGNYVAEYHSMGEAGRVTGISEGQICTAIKTRKSAGGYMWIHKENYNPDEVVTYTNDRFVSVVQIDKDGNYIAEYCNVREAERHTGVLHQNIGKCCREKHRTAGGYFWRHLSEYDPNEVFEYKPHERVVVQLDLDYNFIAEYSSIVNAANATGFLKTSIRSCCAKINKTLYGYRWMYLEDYKDLTKQND